MALTRTHTSAKPLIYRKIVTIKETTDNKINPPTRSSVYSTHPYSLGETASFGGYRGSRGCAPSGAQGQSAEPLVLQGVWGPRKLKAFCFTIFLSHAQRLNALTDFDA